MDDKKTELDSELKDIFGGPDPKDVGPIPIKPSLPVVLPKEEIVVATTKEKDKGELAEDDFNYVRKNLYEVIDAGKEALTTLTDLAQGSEHPRAYEALALLLKNISESTRELIDLHVKMKDITAVKETKVTNNNLIVTTDELIKMIKGHS